MERGSLRIKIEICSVQLLSCVRLLVIPWTVAHQASLSITNSHSLLKLMSITWVNTKTLKENNIVTRTKKALPYVQCPLSVQFSSVAQSCPTLCNPMNRSTPGLPVHHHPARQASLSITISQSSLRLMSIESMMPSSHLILCCPLPLLPPIPPSIRVFSNESTLCMRWPEYWSFSFSIIPSKEIPGLISFRMDWLNLLAVQGTLKSLLRHHIQKHQFFGTQLSS